MLSWQRIRIRNLLVIGVASVLVACSRTITRPVSGTAIAAAQLNVGPMDARAADSVRARVVSSQGPIANAQLFAAFGSDSVRPIDNGTRVCVPTEAATMHLRVRALGYGQLDTTLAAAQVRGRDLEVRLGGVIGTPPLVTTEKVPWWKFWIW